MFAHDSSGITSDFRVSILWLLGPDSGNVLDACLDRFACFVFFGRAVLGLGVPLISLALLLLSDISITLFFFILELVFGVLPGWWFEVGVLDVAGRGSFGVFRRAVLCVSWFGWWFGSFGLLFGFRTMSRLCFDHIFWSLGIGFWYLCFFFSWFWLVIHLLHFLFILILIHIFLLLLVIFILGFGGEGARFLRQGFGGRATLLFGHHDRFFLFQILRLRCFWISLVWILVVVLFVFFLIFGFSFFLFLILFLQVFNKFFEGVFEYWSYFCNNIWPFALTLNLRDELGNRVDLGFNFFQFVEIYWRLGRCFLFNLLWRFWLSLNLSETLDCFLFEIASCFE